MKPLLLLDFDRTLFDTNVFRFTLWSALERLYGVDPEHEIEAARGFYSYNDELYDYNFFAHLSSLDLGDIEEVKSALHQALTGHRFLYQDAMSALNLQDKYDIRILTYGNAAFQLFKISLCPELAAIPVETTLEHKGEYLKTHHEGEAIVLVDDKNLHGELPGNARFIHLDRASERTIATLSGETTVNSLAYLKEVLEQ
jgi:hypothetical protein